MAKHTDQSRRDAAAAFHERAGEVYDLLGRIDAAVSARDPRSRRRPLAQSWADVSELGHVRDQLREVARFLRADEDEPGQR